MNGADLLCDALLANEVEVCFANPGTSEMHFVAALDRKPQLRCVLGLFEGVVTGAADGYARMADKPAATLLHLGPGLANGLANLHNARRARTPIINIVGNHATYHRSYEAPLASDVEALARPMSNWVRSTDDVAQLARDLNDAWVAAVSGPGVATLILPADTAWSEVAAETPVAARRPAPAPAAKPVIAEIETALKEGRQVALMLDGVALREGALREAGRIAAHCGIRLMTPTSVGRIQRGAGRVAVEPVPYRIEAAMTAMETVDLLVLVGAIAPVAFFAYPGAPSVPTRPDTQILEYAGPEADLASALADLAAALGAAGTEPVVQPPVRAERPAEGPLSGESVTAVLARALPEEAIVVDESITTGWRFREQSCGAPRHDLLDLTGGAIGIGLPLAAGAAIACPGRKVICLQADGSGMYTCQALWTHARERMNILTVVFSNRTYATLHGEMKRVGVDAIGENARRMLNLDDPAIDWVGLAQAQGVDAARATTVAELEAAVTQAMSTQGPFLIEAMI
ncbi:acetolactate synthase large subunit [Halodurantibacterium flavum]|uniref:Acetolactate synthase large subunit n=1 Tax=Halodurantibacterium flavum TaxID=1382802 RepID=A0ABW4S2N1_9RHOB